MLMVFIKHVVGTRSDPVVLEDYANNPVEYMPTWNSSQPILHPLNDGAPTN